MKQTAAISALFIFVNSISGLAGQLTKGIQFSADMYTYVAVAFAGGIFGAYFGSLKFKQTILKYWHSFNIGGKLYYYCIILMDEKNICDLYILAAIDVSAQEY
jgi:hypothetical protein